jgi:hypothetical protein
MHRFLLLFLLLAPGLSAAAPAVPTLLDRVLIAPMKTSIYVGSVTLTTAVFERSGSLLSSTYEARVFPWIFWSETGSIRISLADSQLAQLVRGERAEFSGDAENHRGKPRRVSGQATPDGPLSGRIKVRIQVDDVELIFNGRYEFSSP